MSQARGTLTPSSAPQRPEAAPQVPINRGGSTHQTCSLLVLEPGVCDLGTGGPVPSGGSRGGSSSPPSSWGPGVHLARGHIPPSLSSSQGLCTMCVWTQIPLWL